MRLRPVRRLFCLLFLFTLPRFALLRLLSRFVLLSRLALLSLLTLLSRFALPGLPALFTLPGMLTLPGLSALLLPLILAFLLRAAGRPGLRL